MHYNSEQDLYSQSVQEILPPNLVRYVVICWLPRKWQSNGIESVLERTSSIESTHCKHLYGDQLFSVSLSNNGVYKKGSKLFGNPLWLFLPQFVIHHSQQLICISSDARSSAVSATTDQEHDDSFCQLFNTIYNTDFYKNVNFTLKWSNFRKKLCYILLIDILDV